MDRKELIRALESKYGVKAKYLGAPKFDYEIVIKEKIYTISKEGRIVTAGGEEVIPEILLSQQDEIKITDTGFMNYELTLPMEGHTAKTLRNLINMIYSKQELIRKALEANRDLLNEDFVFGINQVPLETMEDFKIAIEGIDLDQGIRFNLDEQTLAFKIELHPSKVDAAINLFALVNKSALAQHYASFKAKPTTNEKYTFRTWLLRLGMIGGEYKKVRKELLGSLSGNGAFKDPSRAGENDET